MDSMVTARVPAQIRERGNAILRELGTTPTELVNAAYAYLIEYGKLPQVASELNPGVRVVGKDMQERFAAFDALRQAPWQGFWDEVDAVGGVKEWIGRERLKDYETLS
jgi:antitoxin component of RelBE/YafQ-DinJ toxin-antitoxin module